MIMKKFWAAVPKGRFVLVSFENELLASAEAVALSKILRNAAHQEVRPLPCRLKDPRNHSGRGRLPVCAAHHDRVLSGTEQFFRHLRKRAIRNTTVQHFFQLRSPSCGNVAD